MLQWQPAAVASMGCACMVHTHARWLMRPGCRLCQAPAQFSVVPHPVVLQAGQELVAFDAAPTYAAQAAAQRQQPPVELGLAAGAAHNVAFQPAARHGSAARSASAAAAAAAGTPGVQRTPAVSRDFALSALLYRVEPAQAHADLATMPWPACRIVLWT